MSGLRLRDAAPADAGAVWRLVRGLAEYERLLDRFTATESGLAALLFGLHAVGRAVLAEMDGRAVGIALWYFTPTTFAARRGLFLEDIFVEPEHRQQGIGFALFRHLARIARDANCWSMSWNVLDWNEPAIAFYRRIGARAVTEWVPQRLDAAGIARLAQ